MPEYESDSDMDGAYGATAPATPPEEGATATEDQSPETEENETANTALISNKVLAPDGEAIKEGDEIVVRVVKNYGDESEIEYAPKKEAPADESGEPMSEEAKELSALSEEGE